MTIHNSTNGFNQRFAAQRVLSFRLFPCLGHSHEAAKILTIFFVAGGRLKSFHAIDNYWIYLLLIVFCVLAGFLIGQGDATSFARWSICPFLSGMIGIHYGYEKALALSDEDLKEIDDEFKGMD